MELCLMGGSGIFWSYQRVLFLRLGDTGKGGYFS